ncbi:hypothetical protein UA08_02953 [Talaromyces atroroseus]|uniref:Alpha/beta hydrolase fold-3 domain-containing protein n=1 Tax=Talaromyces atroroseus TaxID=1441469 RepID=A0A225ARF0_TALAT|nr:hypothetical protein UA08_02953 [Talaromyces atroroseus]OKL62073.1 hypothetical protein UA08_02953 [Talaromyces atroroseus]
MAFIDYSLHLIWVFLVGLGVLIFFFLWSYFVTYSHLRSIPGRFPSQFTNAWAFYHSYIGNSVQSTHRLHEEKGKVVRIQPNHVSIADDRAIPLIYGHGKNFHKSEFYDAFPADKDSATMFASRDPAEHTYKRRLLAHAFSSNALAQLEPLIYRHVELFLKKLDRFTGQPLEGDGIGDKANDRTPFNVVDWMHYLTFDVISDLSFGKPLKMLENEADLAEIKVSPGSPPVYAKAIDALDHRARATTALGRMPYLKPYIAYLFPTARFRDSAKGLAQLTGLASTQVAERLDNPPPEERIDLLTRAIEKQDRDVEGNIIDRRELVIVAFTQLIAGSDTTSNSLSSIVYYVSKASQVMKKLQEELDAAIPDDVLVPTHDMVRNLPYLNSVIKEALRHYSLIGLGLPRAQNVKCGHGLTFEGHYFPPGTTLSVPSYTIHHSQEIWGPDSWEFKPERWESVTERQKNAFLPFSTGPRACIGRNLAEMEMKIVTAAFFKRYTSECHKEMAVFEGLLRKPLPMPTTIRHHVLGRPSTQFRKIQVLAVVSFWFSYLVRGDSHGPPGLRLLSSRLRDRLTPWQTMVITVLWLYVARNFAKIMGFESPEPLANLYSRSYFRATWITTALDAGFWTAMKIRPKWLKDIASIAFSVYYLIAAEQADEKVRRVRATITLEHLRVSWNKATTPYLSFANGLLRPRYMNYAPRQIRIPRPRGSSYREPVNAWLYFNGTLAELREQTQLVLDVPGGGYVAMTPRSADDRLLAWAGRTGVPILSLDYQKAPEYPYPYALNECFDVYRSIVLSRGRCAGLKGQSRPHIVVSGDSAGGNLATGMTIMILQSGRGETRKWLGELPLPTPDGLVLMYPSLDLNIGSWMTEEQMSLIQDRGMRKTNESVLRRKSEDYSRLTPKPSRSFSSKASSGRANQQEEEEQQQESPSSTSPIKDYFSIRHHKEPQNSGTVDAAGLSSQLAAAVSNQPTQIKTRLAVSSMISYFGDRVLTPEMMRAMIILYIGPHNRPDFKTDFLLSPVLAPDAILAAFPKTYFITGERDPLVDDTVIFAGRIRQAKLQRFRERQDLGLEKSQLEFNEKEHVEVNLIPGISHGFVNFPGIFPDGRRHIHKCARWIVDLLEQAAEKELRASSPSVFAAGASDFKSSSSSKALLSQERLSLEAQEAEDRIADGARESRRSSFAESSADEDHPLEMNLTKFTPIKLTQKEDPGIAAVERSSSIKRRNNDNLATSSTEKKINSTKESTFLSNNAIIKKSPAAPKRTNNSFANRRRPSSLSITKSSTNSNTPLSFLPLLKSVNSSKAVPRNGVAGDDAGNDDNDNDDDDDGSKSFASSENGTTLTRLPSEEDLIGRRMNGLAGGLMGLGEGARTP